MLGQGKFAKVYKVGLAVLCVCACCARLLSAAAADTEPHSVQATRKSDHTKFAVKVIDKKNCHSEGELEKVKDEIDIMRRVSHPNCIQFVDMFDAKDKLYIVMELVNGGELFDRIIEKTHFSESEAAHCFNQIIGAVKYLHEIGIVHRDIKPENILYATPAEDSPVKLVDFGLGKIIDVHGKSDKVSHMKTVCGTPSYLAPEIIQRHGYGKECDIWSSGVILYILLCGLPPFDQGAPIPALFNAILHARYSFPSPYWDDVSGDAKDLVKKMLVVDIRARLTPAQILAHPFMVKYEEGSLSKAHISGIQMRLQQWQATRRLKAAINTFVALLRMSSAILSELPDADTQTKILQEVRSDPARMEVLEEAFATLDRDHTGTLDVQNISDSMKSLGVDKKNEEIVAMVKRFDVRNTGSISFDEFCIMMGPAYYHQDGSEKSQRGEFELRSIFQAFDLERTGTINKKELREIMRRLGREVSEEELTKTLSSADTNDDGVIDWDEFKAFMNTKMYTST